MVNSICWNDTTNMLAAVQEGKFSVWYYPNVLYVDKDLINKTVMEKDSSEFGSTQIVSFVGNLISIRRMDGSLISTPVSPYPSILHGFVTASKWDDAIRLCRFIKRALDLAIRYKTHVDTVLAYRQKYLDKFERKEIIKQFLQFSN
uniref:Uncharacterized protein n=1 Tax=Strigamia maritima TaxID=126957 RepID=T1JAI6_STRMM